jgi:hypothetical protein
MKSMIHAFFLANRFGRLMKWPRLGGLLGLLLAPSALATIPLYQNDAALHYAVPGNPPPNIDATNFVNNNSFSVDLDYINVGLVTVDYYEPWNVRNYTNNGFMSVTTDDPLIFYPTPGFYAGIVPTFQFDTQTTGSVPHLMANSFNNSGEIDSGGQLIVSATNILDPGIIVMGPNSVMRFTGGNVDLTRMLTTMEGFGSIFGGTLGISSLYATVGTDTNADWSPTNLMPAKASSSGPAASQLVLPGSTPYFHVSGLGTSNIITWAIFLDDQSTLNVTHNVYFNGNTATIGGGFDTIEWIGAYTDPVTGTALNNYLYLNDGTALSTNITVSAVGIPGNFYLTNSTSQVVIGPAAASGFPSGFAYSPGYVTNYYSYLNAQIISTTTATNANSQNPSGAFTNLPDRIYITASQELNLTMAEITGPNYLSLMATNQFDGSAGAVISAPYSDISLGVTNGFLPVTNVLQAALPNWSGMIQAWSGRWIIVDTNGVTNDFRVLLVSSRVSPTTPSQVQHLTLHGTNVVISDTFSVLSTLSIDAQNLTLTTNGYGNGATSPEGELNMVSTAILWPGSLPNLLNLTNNGAIRAQNLIAFGSPPPGNYLTFINNGLISDQGATIYANYFENGGTFANNGLGSFLLQSLTTVLTNGSLTAGGDVSITTGSLVASNLVLQAGRSLTLQVTNLLTDNGAASGNIWYVGGANSVGLNLPFKPLAGDLLGTTIYCSSPATRNKQVVNTWAGANYGVSTLGYKNNEAVGVLILDALGSTSTFQFNGVGTNNALYVDELELLDSATNFNGTLVGALSINTNLVIYYAQAMANGVSVAEKLNHLNNNRLRWVPQYAGHFSSVSILYPDGKTYTFNAALAQSDDIDSNGNTIVNASDPTPFFVPDQMNFTLTLTNRPPLMALLSWQSISGATNYIQYATNLISAPWINLTNFITSGPLTFNWMDTNRVSSSAPRFYRLRIDQNSTQLYGPGF